jgi:hypothetical protein
MTKNEILGELCSFSSSTRRIHAGWNKKSGNDVINEFDRIVLPCEPGQEAAFSAMSAEERGKHAAWLLDGKH